MNRGYFYGESSQRNIAGCKDIVQQLCERAMQIANERKTYCPDFGISRGKSTTREQYELFKKGREKQDGEWVVIDENKVVTNCDGKKIKSAHQSGYAIDFFAISPDTGKADYRAAMMALVATCFFEAATDLGVNINWGGSFKSISDCPHVEVIGYE